jgi:hypothetical protein
MIASAFGFGNALGGPPRGVPIRSYALGGPVAGRDSVFGMLDPEEIVMSRSAVDMVGRDRLLRINALAGRRVREEAAPVAAFFASPKREPDNVNVWVVSPDQIPPPGPRDIVAHVAQNIRQKGTLRTLIRQVQMGG